MSNNIDEELLTRTKQKSDYIAEAADRPRIEDVTLIPSARPDIVNATRYSTAPSPERLYGSQFDRVTGDSRE